MAQLVYLKESIIYFYKKHAEILLPLLKLIFSFFALNIIQNMFQYNTAVNKPAIFLVVSAAQAFLPISFLYAASVVLILLNLWKLSGDILLGCFIFFLICWLIFIRVDRKYSFLIVMTAVMFSLKIEYVLPVLLGMTVGFASIIPVVAGIILFYLSVYMADVSTLLTTSTSSSFGMGIQRVVNLMLIDKQLLVMLVTFSFIIFITTLLCRIFHERAWMLSIFVGNIAMSLLLLSGRLIFELNYSIWRVFLEIILGIFLCFIYRFFRGIGDISRIERVSFEDDEYFYYVKAVPKIKVSQKDRNVTNIHSVGKVEDILMEEDEEKTEAAEEDTEIHKDPPDSGLKEEEKESADKSCS